MQFDPYMFTLEALKNSKDEIEEGQVIYCDDPDGDLKIVKNNTHYFTFGSEDAVLPIIESSIRVEIDSPHGEYKGKLDLLMFVGEENQYIIESIWTDLDPEEES